MKQYPNRLLLLGNMVSICDIESIRNALKVWRGVHLAFLLGASGQDYVNKMGKYPFKALMSINCVLEIKSGKWEREKQ